MSATGGRRHVLDSLIARSDAGRLLVGGAPGRMIRLSAAGADALDLLLSGEPPSPAADGLRERLLAAGMIHPVADDRRSPPLTTIVPVRDGGPGLGALVAELRQLGPVIVVDDGSGDDSAAVSSAAGARVEPNRREPGPAGARNTGLALAETEFVAFIDADCRSLTPWAPRLCALLDEDPALALAAPRVRSARGDDALARYETHASPLDMGEQPSLVGPGRRVAFVPSTALLARRSALLELGGFDESRRVGEDVDLVFRLLRRGWRVRYEPGVWVEHRSRRTLGALMRQRFAYAGSAAALDRAHPGTVAPLTATPQGVAVWLAFAADARVGAAALGGGVAATALRQGDAEARRALALLALRSHLFSARHLARALARDWMPLTALASLRWRRARKLALIAIAVDVASASRSDAQPQPVLVRAALRLADNLSYAAGLWLGAGSQRSAGAILPRLEISRRRAESTYPSNP